MHSFKHIETCIKILQVLVCNYGPGGNIIRGAMYIKDDPGSLCKKGMKMDFVCKIPRDSTAMFEMNTNNILFAFVLKLHT